MGEIAGRKFFDRMAIVYPIPPCEAASAHMILRNALGKIVRISEGNIVAHYLVKWAMGVTGRDLSVAL